MIPNTKIEDIIPENNTFCNLKEKIFRKNKTMHLNNLSATTLI